VHLPESCHKTGVRYPLHDRAQAGLEIFGQLRSKSLEWSRVLLQKRDASNSADERQDFSRRVVTMALICCCTFDVGTLHLETVLSDDDDAAAAAVLLESSIIITEDTSPDGYPRSDPLLAILFPRWRRISFEAEAFLRKKIVNQAEVKTCLDMALKERWPTYSQPNTPWSVVGWKHEHVLVASLCATSGQKSRGPPSITC
jgi:hypothetical protein